jgi:hypothetical protein
MNPFKASSWLYPFRWFLLVTAAIIVWEVYADYTGWRIFSVNNQQQWSAAGPGGHK